MDSNRIEKEIIIEKDIPLKEEEEEKEDEKEKEEASKQRTHRLSISTDVLQKYKVYGPKQQQGFLEMTMSLENYVTEFNSYFYKEPFQKHVKNIKYLIQEKFNKLIEIKKSYFDNIKEVEIQLSGLDKNDPACNSLELELESLKDEEQSEIDRIEDQYDGMIKKIQNEFKSKILKTDSGIALIEEQFRLHMVNKISELIAPSKK